MTGACDCSFGEPRQKGQPATTAPEAKKKYSGNKLNKQERGTSIKVGCQCSFTIKQLYIWPGVAQVDYQHAHVGADGKACHGPGDPNSHYTRLGVAAHLTDQVGPPS